MMIEYLTYGMIQSQGGEYMKRENKTRKSYLGTSILGAIIEYEESQLKILRLIYAKAINKMLKEQGYDDVEFRFK